MREHFRVAVVGLNDEEKIGVIVARASAAGYEVIKGCVSDVTSWQDGDMVRVYLTRAHVMKLMREVRTTLGAPLQPCDDVWDSLWNVVTSLDPELEHQI